MTATVTQAGTAPVGSHRGPELDASSTATAIPAGSNTDILEVIVRGLRYLGVVFSVTTNDLDVFTVSAKFSKDDSFHALYTGITSTPAGLITAASGTLAAQGAGTTGWFVMDVRGLYAIKITVSGTVADTTAVTIYAGGGR